MAADTVHRPHKRARVITVQDTVLGPATLPSWVFKIVDTPEFQRLRGLRQTGLLRYVFPGATHDRFSHSLGTATYAYDFMRSLAEAQPELGITPAETHTVTVAALCHDLGHGPGSHFFERFMAVADPAWTHERQSVLMLQHLVGKRPQASAALTDAGVDIHMVCEMMLGYRSAAPPDWKWKGPPTGRSFLYEVVSNKDSGMDVDKLDYLSRDSTYVKIGVAHDPQALVKLCRVVDGHLAWPVSQTTNVMNLFMARYNLHAMAYQHKTVRCVERMASDALLLLQDMVVGYKEEDAKAAADCGSGSGSGSGSGMGQKEGSSREVVMLKDAARDPVVFTALGDWVVDVPLMGFAIDLPPAAAAIFAAIRERRLWTLTGQACLPAMFEFNEAEVAAALSALAGVPPEDFVVDVACLHHGKGKHDPVIRVHFFVETDSAAGGVTPQRQLVKPSDYLKPASFQRRVVRVFSKTTAAVPALTDAFAKWRALNGMLLVVS